MWETISSGKVWRGDFHNQKKSGEYYWEAASISPIFGSNGEITHYVAVKEDITERKETEAKLEELNRQLIDVSRRAGMAEVATGVLHNVGNVLNSVNVSAEIVSEKLMCSKLGRVADVARLLKDNEDRSVDFLAEDPKGRQIPLYLERPSMYLDHDREELLDEINRLTERVSHI